MNDARLGDMTHQMQEYVLAYTPEQAQLLLQLVQQLARGHSLSAEQVDHLSADLEIAPEAAHQIVSELAEQDEAGQMVGAAGFSLAAHQHRLLVGGIAGSAWCALDTLLLLALLQQTATIAAPSPVTSRIIRLRVSPLRVEEVSPPEVVVSLVLVDLRREQMASVEAIWGAFCRHVHFFTTRDEAERWTVGREDIAVLMVEEGFAWGRQVWSNLFPSLSVG